MDEDLEEIIATIRHLMSDGRPRMARQIAAELEAYGYDVNTRWVNQTLHRIGRDEFQYDNETYTYSYEPQPAYHESLAPYFIRQWQGQDYALLRYQPRRFGVTPANQFVIEFKSNFSNVVQQAAEYSIQEIIRNTPLLRDQYNCRSIMVVPPSRAFAPNAPCEQVAATIASRVPWLTHRRQALSRWREVPKSSQAHGIEERLDYYGHKETIVYSGDRTRIPQESILLIDDVITHGQTSRACREILLEATGCKAVVGFFLARTC